MTKPKQRESSSGGRAVKLDSQAKKGGGGGGSHLDRRSRATDGSGVGQRTSRERKKGFLEGD